MTPKRAGLFPEQQLLKDMKLTDLVSEELYKFSQM